MSGDYVARHYGERAGDYVASAVHSQGADLDAIERLVAGKGMRRVLDLGCGGGHVSYRLAPHVGEVVACDVTAPMLAAVTEEARRQGLSNITAIQAPAECLPFANGLFDAVFCRFTTHHWADAATGLREERRVLASSGCALFIDVTAPASALADSWLQTLELLRDITHVRDYALAEWAELLARAGFTVTEIATHRLRMAFESWVARARTPAERIEAIRSLQRAAPPEVIRHFAVESDGSFTLDVSTFLVAP